MADLNEAKRKLESVMMDWFTNDTIMLNVMCMLDKVADPNQETMGIDIRGRTPTLRYNPNFINSISKERLELIMASEGFKVLLRHATTRLKEPKQISALSSSITINQLMNNSIKNLLAGLDEFVPSPEKFDLEPNLFYEQYYRDLMERVNEIKDKIKQIWNSMTQKEKEELIKNASSSGSQEEDQEGQEGQEGQGEGKDSDGFKEYKDQKEAIKDYFDPNGTANQGWGQNDLFDAELKNFIDDKKNSNLTNWGKFTGDARVEIIAANEPKISYKEIIRRFSRSVIMAETITSRMKINRRYDFTFPGYRRKYKTKVIFAVDVSGSMSDDDLKEGFAVINSCLKHAEMIYVQFDTEIKSVERNVKKARKEFKVMGRGGTDFNQVLEMADREQCDGIVIYTDGCAAVPKQPKAKVLWLMHSKDLKPPVDWNYVAYLDRFEDAHKC